MKIEKTIKNETDTNRNSFGQYVTEFHETEYTTIYGTVEEAIQYSHQHSCYVGRSPETEHLFPAWDDGCKYVELYMGKVFTRFNSLHEINGAGWYVHKFVVVCGDNYEQD